MDAATAKRMVEQAKNLTENMEKLQEAWSKAAVPQQHR